MKGRDSMYKVILIEDDVPVLRQLKRIISGTSSEFEIAMTFTHPLDALDYLKENTVDAVITDIQLPEMTGIEFCRYCQTHYPNIKFAILSAYDNFDYAQKAIELEVCHYMLKPITIQKLETLLAKLSDKIAAQKESEGFVAASVTLKRQQTIVNLLSGFYSDYNTFFEDMRKNDVMLTPDTCRAGTIYASFDNFFALLKEKPSYTREDIYKIASKIISRNNPSLYSVLFNYSEDNIAIFVFGKTVTDAETFEKNLSAYIDEISQDTQRILNIGVTINSIDTFADIDAFYKSQRRDSSYEEQAKNIMYYVYENDFESAVRCVEAVRMIFDETQVQLIYTSILSHLSKLTQKTFSDDNLSSDKLLNIILSDIKDIKRYNLTDISKTDVIDNACKFIKDNFANDITLNDVAQHVFLNPIYFSSYFKKKTGEKYSDYLAHVKLGKAKELLSETDIKISTIAEMSGFRDTNYFHKTFKSQTGLTPVEYRKKYGSNA